MYQTSFQPNTRLDVADVLRGVAIMGIILLHNVEHMNFYSFPEETSEWMRFFNTMTWKSAFFVFGGKMYSIFALMFGLSFFIQNDNQMQKGRSFAWRFEWRMVLLVGFGMLNTFFFNGDILVSYALFGMLMPLVARCGNRTVALLSLFLLIQPVEIYQLVSVLLNPNYQLIDADSGRYFAAMGTYQSTGSIWECGWANLKYGQLGTFAWDFESGRLTQLPGLFFLGLLVGRKRLFYNEGNHLKIWLSAVAASIVAFFIFFGMNNLLPSFIQGDGLRAVVGLLLKSWANLAQMIFYVSLLVVVFYSISRVRKGMMHMAFFGRMSMTNYFLQSILGALLYYGWGLGLHRHCGPAYSFLIGIVMLVGQYVFCRWWISRHSHGPFEGLWKKLTWIKIGRN